MSYTRTVDTKGLQNALIYSDLTYIGAIYVY
jgi:hypothetical protein